jgi:hypothetical protein
MKLSGNQFQQIISQLVSDKQQGQNERRHEPRVGIRAQGFVAVSGPDGRALRQVAVTIRDLSPAGICIVTPAPIPKGTRFTLRLIRVEQTALLALYEVRHCKPASSGFYSIGAHLVSISEGTGAAGAA